MVVLFAEVRELSNGNNELILYEEDMVPRLKHVAKMIEYQVGSFAERYLVDEVGISESRLVPLGTPDAYADALLKGSDNGGVAASSPRADGVFRSITFIGDEDDCRLVITEMEKLKQEEKRYYMKSTRN
ncbi:hypothetical protein LXL04_029192 [Taraxacum kok-saghyz]